MPVLAYFILLLTADLLMATEASPFFQSKAGDLEIQLRSQTNGITLIKLFDHRTQRDLLATPSLPLFNVKLRQVSSTQEVNLAADTGWQRTAIQTNANGFSLRWEQPINTALHDISIVATVTTDAPRNALRWQVRVMNNSSDWGTWRVVFPQIALAELSENASVFFPRGPGEVQTNLWRRAFAYRGDYPGGWCAMQFMAAYSTTNPASGFYLAVEDPWGSTKNLLLESTPASRSVAMRFEHPAPDMGKKGQGFELSGEAVWQLFQGDWFDAAKLYQRWIRQEARWWPRMGQDGREDTPRWMRELSAWGMSGGAPSTCVPVVKRFQEYLGVPVGYHWYNWHQIPFDNDYPHYFPAKEGFAQGVAEAQRSHVYIMPYINGRLWDSHDRGFEDFEFSQLALPAATKDSTGKPYVESYGSKETNGQPVQLAAMCPSTPLWQDTVSNIVLKLLKENGTRSVYIDQVAAAAPTLCMDATHGHPLGGGHWWNEGYWQMLSRIRQVMPPDTMITTECNGEPFVRWFDGYLTWHWQYDGQVPAFPLVYGGAIQMFGRAYRGGATKDLALRMKAGQQWVFGEQLGWIDPGFIKEKENAEFFRQLVQLRARCNRFFYAGEMGRPPKLLGNIPQVKADWQWSKEWWVTTDAVLTGAWLIPAEQRAVLLFVNVSDAPVEAALKFDAKTYGLGQIPVMVKTITSTGMAPETEQWPASGQRPLVLPARQARVLELSTIKN